MTGVTDGAGSSGTTRRRPGPFESSEPDLIPFPGSRLRFGDAARRAWLYDADCIEFMGLLKARYPAGIFDLIFADPPYFLSNGGITCHAGRVARVDKGKWDKSRGADLNHAFNTAWLTGCRDLLRPDGTLWVSGTHHVIHSVGFAMQQLGMKVLNDVTWEKRNPPPNISCRYFTHATETIIWAARDGRSRHRFNYQAMRDMNEGRQMKSIWRMAAPAKEEKRHGKHPTQKPEELLERILLAATGEGDLVFDPFAGSSTTGVAAIRLGRGFVGCEQDPAYLEISARRLRDAVDDANLGAAKR